MEISKRDVKAIQQLYWILSTTSMLLFTTVLFFDFSINTVLIWFFCFSLNGIFQYLNTKIWNIWYENKNLYFQNIYKSQRIKISDFKKIEMTSPVGAYKLYLINGESYNFGLRPTDDLKLLFKADPQFYAKEMTQKLNKLKQEVAE